MEEAASSSSLTRMMPRSTVADSVNAMVMVTNGYFGDQDEAIMYGNGRDLQRSFQSNDTLQVAPPVILPFPASAYGRASSDAAAQIATLQAKLNQRLGPEYISTRQGPGGNKLSYLQGWKAIDLANEVFGFNGWSSSITQLTTDFLDETSGFRCSCGVTAVVRITLTDGTFHEDIGYGSCDNAKGKAMALEKAKKEAVTDATKRAMRTFGRLLGNCLYDKSFVDNASKLKPVPPNFHLDSLKRSPEQMDAAPAPKVETFDSKHGAQQAGSSTVPFPAARVELDPPPNVHIGPEHDAKLEEKNAAHASGPVQRETKPLVTLTATRSAATTKQSNKALSREDRVQMAALKKAALRQKKLEEDAERRHGEEREPVPPRSIQLERVERQLKLTSREQRLARVRALKQELLMDEVDLLEGGVDEYDVALIEADLGQEREGMGTDARGAILKLRTLNEIDDSGIAWPESPSSKAAEKSSPASKRRKGTFLASSPPDAAGARNTHPDVPEQQRQQRNRQMYTSANQTGAGTMKRSGLSLHNDPEVPNKKHRPTLSK